MLIDILLFPWFSGIRVPKLNIFRLYPKQRSNLVALLGKRGFDHIQTISTLGPSGSVELSLYFTTNPIKRPIKWVSQLRSVFSLPDVAHDNYGAVVLVSWNQGNSLYVASYGLAHFYVARFADIDFGIEVASRIELQYKIKNSREFGGARTKSIETYQPIGDLVFEPGESVSYVKGTPADQKAWGKTISCGQSVSLRKRDFDPSALPRLCHELDVLLSQKVVKEIPRSVEIREKTQIHALQNSLIKAMESRNYMVSISQQQLSGVDFLFSDRYDYLLKTPGGQITLDDSLDLDELARIVNKELHGDFSKLLDASVEAIEDGERAFTQPFIKFIDYVDSANNHYLEDGRWYQYDKNYLSNVRLAVDRIELEHSKEIPVFDETAYQTWLRENPNEQLSYRESYLNSYLANAYGYENRDRDFELFEGSTVELADLVKGSTLFVVKIGKPQKLGYAVDQAASAIHVLARNNYHIRIGDSVRPVERVCLWLVLERKKPINRISDINSLIFLTKLAHWRRQTLLSQLYPEIRISYRR